MAETPAKSRIPKCARCRNHGYTVNLKGHKGFCPYKTCACDQCGLVKERQEVSKRQIKLRRQQQQEELMGVHVPVPPSIFSHGSICGINLDYLRVVFPRKRVDRLYAVLLECNNDVNAAAAKLQQEETMGGAGDSLENSAQQVAVLKINKATQWTSENVPANSSMDNTPTQSRQPQQNASTTTNNQTQQGHHNSPPPQQQQQTAEDCKQQQQTTGGSHCLFPYCWSQSVPAQYSPPTSLSMQSGDQVKVLSAPRPQNKLGFFAAETFPVGCASVVSPEVVSSIFKLGPEEKKPMEVAEDELPEVSKAVLPQPASSCHLGVSSGAHQPCPLWSISNDDVSDLEQLGNHSNASLTYVTLTSKTPLQKSERLYSSTALTTTTITPTSAPVPWPELPTAPMTSRITLPFALPPPPILTLPPVWTPRTLPPLPLLPPPVSGLFHTTGCGGGMPAPFHPPQASTSDVSVLPHSMAFTSTLDHSLEGDSLGSPEILEDLDVINVVVEKAYVSDNAKSEEDDVGDGDHRVNVITSKTSNRAVCRDSNNASINSAQF